MLALLAMPGGVQPEPGGLYDFTAHSLRGQSVPLDTYRGKVSLVVNLASQCGYTGQYAGLQRLWEQYAARGLVVLGFPSNDFGAQEPGSAAQIEQFCQSNYGITFPMFEKVSVLAGPQQSPVYRFLSAAGEFPSWNFCKYLVDRQGRPLGFFNAGVTPESPELHQAIETALQT